MFMIMLIKAVGITLLLCLVFKLGEYNATHKED